MEKYTGSKILVVDDEPANIFLLEGILTENGYKVSTAINGKDALKIISEIPQDTILLDIMMPEMTGIEVLEKIVSIKNIRDIPVIIVSAKTEVEDVKIALDKGAIDYIKKPIDEIDLLARVRVALRLKDREDKIKRLVKLKDEFIGILAQHGITG